MSVGCGRVWQPLYGLPHDYKENLSPTCYLGILGGITGKRARREARSCNKIVTAYDVYSGRTKELGNYERRLYEGTIYSTHPVITANHGISIP